MKIDSIVIRLGAWMQAELDAQRRLAKQLGALETAVRAADDPGVARVALALDRELAGQPARGRVRDELFGAFGKAWGVAPRSLTIASIAERAAAGGLDVTRLTEARAELRAVATATTDLGRRVAALARRHQDVLAELMGLLFPAGPTQDHEGARLVDARG